MLFIFLICFVLIAVYIYSYFDEKNSLNISSEWMSQVNREIKL